MKKQPTKNTVLLNKGVFKMSASDKKIQKECLVRTSKTEYFFMHAFLDKLGIRYIHQWTCPAKFVYDFAVFQSDGVTVEALIEVDGDYYHAHPAVVEKQGFLYENQKRQIERDGVKNEWAALNGYILLRFWESDIKKHSKSVLNVLKKRLSTCNCVL